MKFEIKQVIKALLFSTSIPLSTKDIADILRRYRVNLEAELLKASDEDKLAIQTELDDYPSKLKSNDLDAPLQELSQELEASDDVYRLIQCPEGFSIAVAPQFAPWIRLLRNEDKPMKLSGAAMESLALVAYRQPITRAEMEMIRGVSVDSAIQKLTEYDLIYVQGQANLPGKPRLYATTDKFLKFCGVSSLEELPASDVLAPQQINEWVQDANKREIYSNQDLGLQEAEASLEDVTHVPEIAPFEDDANDNA